MKLSNRLKEIIRFLIIGGLATVIDYAIYFLFKGVILNSFISEGLSIIIAEILGYVAGLIFNWVFSKGFVFHFEGKSTSLMFLKYVILCLLGLGLTTLVMYVAKPLYGIWTIQVANHTFKLIELGFKVTMTLIVLVINYIGRKYWIFVDKQEGE